MPEITEDERGRRVFQIHKGMAVETALEKIRQSVGQDWKLYSDSDIAILKYMLGERIATVGGSVHSQGFHEKISIASFRLEKRRSTGSGGRGMQQRRR